jgi:hypothetical protein
MASTSKCDRVAMTPITYLTVAAIVVIHQRMIDEFGGDPGLRDLFAWHVISASVLQLSTSHLQRARPTHTPRAREVPRQSPWSLKHA